MRFVRELDEYPVGAKRRKILIMAILASLITAYEGAMAPVLPLMLRDLHMSLTLYGRIIAGALIFGAIAGLIGGWLSDRYGRVRVLIPMMMLTAFLAFAMALVTNVVEFAIGACVLLFVESVGVAATIPLVRDFSPRMGRAMAMGLWTCGPVGANFVSAGIAALTLPLFHNAWQSQYIIVGCLSLVASIVIALNIADLSPRLRAEVLETERKVIEDASTNAAPASPRMMLLSPLIWAHNLGNGFWLVFYVTVTVFGQTILVHEFHKTPAEASSIMTGFWVLDIIMTIVIGRLSDVLQLRRIFVLVFTVIFGLLVLYFAHLMGHADTTSTQTLVIMGALIGGAMGATYSPWMAMYSENAEDIDPRLQGYAWGMYNSIIRVVITIAVLYAPVVVGRTGSWREWFILSAICVVPFAIAIFFFKGPWTRAQVKNRANSSMPLAAPH
jgi:OPA family glycerol-3-phosphate transporter-like MFS transporter